MQNYPITVRAHTNIALIKYWGKKNEDLIIPENSSLSLTLDNFYTDTTVEFLPHLKHDQLFINNNRINNLSQITNFLNIIRKQAHCNYYAMIKSTNHVPTSAGMASSASAFSALAASASYAAGLKLSLKNISRLARRGSGSASRSVYGGFVEWNKGNSDQNSYAFPIQEHPKMKINLITVIVSRSHKKISSREGMKRSVKTSPYYYAWKESTAHDLILAKNAIKNNDFNQLGKVAENNAMKMHALTISAKPNFIYFNPDTIRIINQVKKLRQIGINCYFTMDAGPNVVVICLEKDSQLIKKNLSKLIKSDNIIVSGSGKGIEFLHKNI